MKRLVLLCILALTLQACSNMEAKNIMGTSWVLSEWPKQTMPNTSKKATLNFEAENRVSGKSFCNGYGGSVSIIGDTIKFGELIGTMMYCDDVGEAEKKYTEDLKSTNTFKVVGGKLQLLKDGQVLMAFSRAE